MLMSSQAWPIGVLVRGFFLKKNGNILTISLIQYLMVVKKITLYPGLAA